MTRGNDIPTNIASGLSVAWMALDPTDTTKVLLATELPLAVYACSIPAVGPGKATCAPRPAAQGLACFYPQWTSHFVHAASLSTIWVTLQGSSVVLSSSDRGATFAPLTLPAPCLPPGGTTAFAGHPNDPKTFVIAQIASPRARLLATKDGGVTFVEVPAFPGSSQNVTDLAIDASGALVMVSGDSVLRRATF